MEVAKHVLCAQNVDIFKRVHLPAQTIFYFSFLLLRKLFFPSQFLVATILNIFVLSYVVVDKRNSRSLIDIMGEGTKIL